MTEAAEDLDDLLLIDDAAVGHVQDRAQQLVLVADLFRVRRALDEAGDRIHRAGAVERDDGGDVLDALRPQAGAYACHARALELEHAGGLSFREHAEGLFVVVRHFVDAEVRRMAAHHVLGVLEHREVAQPEEVHLQQAQLLERRHLVLADHGLVVLRQRDVLVDRFFGDDHAGGVGGGVAGHALERASRVDEAFHLPVAVVKLLERLGQAQRLVDGHVQRRGDLLGGRVGLGVGDVQRPRNVADRHARRHRAEGDDLRDVIRAVEPRDVVDDLAAAVDAEVHVDIRHGHALGVEEALEEETVLDRVDVRDVQAVGHDSARGAAAPGAYGDIPALGVVDEVLHDQEVVDEAHLPDDAQLVVHLLVHLGTLAVALEKALLAELSQIARAALLALRQLEARQVIVAELKVEGAFFGDLRRVVRGLLPVGVERAHLRLVLEEELLRLELHAHGVVDGASHLDAHEHVLVIGVLPRDVMRVVGQHEGDARLAPDAVAAAGGHALLADAVVLDLQIEVLAEDLAQPQRALLRSGVVVVDDLLLDLAGETAGETDQPLGMFFEQRPVDAGLDVKALGEGGRHEIAEIAVARLVPAQQKPRGAT